MGGGSGCGVGVPALGVTGPYLAMVTIAFAFIVQHGATEWKELTGGANGLMNLKPPAIGGKVVAEREMAIFAVLIAGASLYFFYRLAPSGCGKGMVGVRDAGIAGGSVRLYPGVMPNTAVLPVAVL